MRISDWSSDVCSSDPAGEAGRGFAVVADEVQRLAERASNATKRIETLVQAIQSDTNEAVSSMEQTTSEVVAGAPVPECRDSALRDREHVYNTPRALSGGIPSPAQQLPERGRTHI